MWFYRDEFLFGLRFMMRFFKGHFSACKALGLLSIFSTAASAGVVDCLDFSANIDDGHRQMRDALCKYVRIESVRDARLFIVDDEDHIGNPAYAIAHKDFLIYVPKEVSADTVEATLAGSNTAVKNMLPVTSDDKGIVHIDVKGRYPYYNFELGTALEAEDQAPVVNLIYNFYAPELEFSVDGEVVTDASKIGGTVGDTVYVDVRAVIPVGPSAGKTDSTLKKTFYFSLPGESENLEFFSAGEQGSSLKMSDGSIRLNIEDGVARFKVVATKSITDGSSFVLGGFPDPKDPDKFIVNDKFPGELQFVNPDMSVLEKSAIFDTDGDGVGDSIAVWFGGNVETDSVESFFYSWPTDDSFQKYAGREFGGKSVYGLPDIRVSIQKENAAGAVKACIYSSLGERRDTLKAALQDSIGAVIQTASLIKGAGKSDTLVLRFNKRVDSTWTDGRGLMLNGKPVEVHATKKNGLVWSFAVGTGVVSVGDSVKIVTACEKANCPDGILTAEDGVPTAKNNQYVKVTNAGKLYLSNENNGFYDRDGDGRMDSVSVGFDMPITADDLKNLELKFYWLNEKGELLEIAPSVKDLVISDDGLVVGYPLDPEKYGVMGMLTAIDKSYSKDGSVEYGYAKLINKVTVDGKETEEETSCEMNDYMPPVIAGNFLNPESFQEMEPDRFRVTFSEPVDYKNLDLSNDILSFYIDGSWQSCDLGDAQWSDDGRSVIFMMQAGQGLTDRMNPADSVRFNNFTSGLKDVNGNYVSEKSPAVMVKGDPRVVMQTTSMADLTRAEELSTRVKPFTIDHVKSGLSEEQKASLGVLMDVGFATIMKDSAGVSVADVSKIGLKWELYVYTNLGAFVGSASGKIDCDDPFFNGNCLENPDKLYIRWNMRADNGRKVGVGLYLAKFNIKVFGAEEDFNIERVFRWGVTATRR